MIFKIDDRREAMIFDAPRLIPFLVDDFYKLLYEAIEKNGVFNVALAGGSTPKKLYQALTSDPRALNAPWDKVHIFYGDERAVPLDHEESNYHMSLESGFKLLKKAHLHPMPAFKADAHKQADYEKALPDHLDLIYLGMGDDGHTASLFPHDPLLKVDHRKTAFGYIECKNADRMTLTLPYINESKQIRMLVTGSNKAEKIEEVLSSKGQEYPAYHIGKKGRKAIFVLDMEAGSRIITQ